MSAEAADFDEAVVRRYFAQGVTFEKSVADLSGLPAADRCEVAFAGRSNVGKSSLINALVNRRDLARASAEPGRTRLLNFFALGEGVRLVDLPGYGYAKAPKTEIARWTALTGDYLRGRPGLTRVFLLIDSRHGIMDNDAPVMDALDRAAVVYQATLTKIDKLKPAERAARLAETDAKLRRRPAAHPRVLAVSSHTGEGLDALRAEIMALAGAPTTAEHS